MKFCTHVVMLQKKDDPNVDADEPAPSAERAALADIEKHIKQLENLQGQLSKGTNNKSVDFVEQHS